jgi:hypothetical protein
MSIVITNKNHQKQNKKKGHNNYDSQNQERSSL